MPDELISGATDTQYVPTNPDDLGRYVYCRVRGDNAFGFSTANSNVIGPIAVASDLVNTDPPEITIASGGDSLTSDTGTWTGSPTITHGYLWFQADDAAGTGAVSIPLATSATYTIDGGTITPPATGSAWSPTDLYETADGQLDLTDGDHTVTGRFVAGYPTCQIRGSASRSTGKKYFELIVVRSGSNSTVMGLCDGVHSLSGGVLAGAANSLGIIIQCQNSISVVSITFDSSAGNYYLDTTVAEIFPGDVFGFAVDFDLAGGTLWLRYNGTWKRGDPAAGTDGCAWGAGPADAMFPYFATLSTIAADASVTLNTGPTFAAALPTGFTAWG